MRQKRQRMTLNRALLNHVTLDPAGNCSEPGLQDSGDYVNQRPWVTKPEDNRAPWQAAAS